MKIKKYPSFCLRKKCSNIELITSHELKLFDEMLQTMYLGKGIGLAGPQIGINKNIIVIDIGEGAIKLANPEILKFAGKDYMIEGCLSLPDAQVDIARATQLKVRGLNEKGNNIEIEANGLLARVFQHEIDHLQGKLIIDYLNKKEKFKYQINNIFPHKKNQNILL